MDQDYVKMVRCPECGGLMVEGKSCRRCAERHQEPETDSRQASEEHKDTGLPSHQDTPENGRSDDGQPAAGSGKDSAGEIILVVVVLLIAISVVADMLDFPSSRDEATQASDVASGGATGNENSSSPFGDVGQLWVEKAPVVPVAVSKSALSEHAKLSMADDLYGLRQLVDSGLVVMVDRGTSVRVIDIGFGVKRVRVLEGLYAGFAGWTSSGWVK